MGNSSSQDSEGQDARKTAMTAINYTALAPDMIKYGVVGLITAVGYGGLQGLAKQQGLVSSGTFRDGKLSMDPVVAKLFNKLSVYRNQSPDHFDGAVRCAAQLFDIEASLVNKKDPSYTLFVFAGDYYESCMGHLIGLRNACDAEPAGNIDVLKEIVSSRLEQHLSRILAITRARA